MSCDGIVVAEWAVEAAGRQLVDWRVYISTAQRSIACANGGQVTARRAWQERAS